MSLLSFKFSYWRSSAPLQTPNKRKTQNNPPPQKNSVALKKRDPGMTVEFFDREPGFVILEQHCRCNYGRLGFISPAPRAYSRECCAVVIMFILAYLHIEKHTTLFPILAVYTAFLTQPPLQWFRHDLWYSKCGLKKKSLPFLVWRRRTYHPLSYNASWLLSWYGHRWTVNLGAFSGREWSHWKEGPDAVSWVRQRAGWWWAPPILNCTFMKTSIVFSIFFFFLRFNCTSH